MYSSWKTRPQQKAVHATKPLILGVVGGSCSGKTDLCKAIQQQLQGKFSVAIISQNQFYRKDITGDSTQLLANYDHPDAFDYDALATVLKALKRGESVTIRKSDVAPVRPEDVEESVTIPGDVDVVMVKGILTWYRAENLYDIKVYVAVDPDVRLSERVMRDIKQGRKLEDILDYYFTFAKIGHEKFTEPLSTSANMIIPRGNQNKVGIEIVASYIHNSLSKTTRSLQ
eukprot:m.96070 g.96070  ORF g.96070 m.96070 type:complete len:228 (-) comp14780_c2_seq1:64-747(-)